MGDIDHKKVRHLPINLATTDYEKKQLYNQFRKLKYYTSWGNEEREEKIEERLFYNLSMKETLHKISKTFNDIMTDLLESDEKLTSRRLAEIFVKGDRLIYVSIMVFIIALGMAFMGITS